MAAYLPGFTWITNPRNGGGTYADDGPSRILLHMTVSRALSASYVSVHPYPPHLWANPYTGDRWQTVSLDRSAFALYQPSYGNVWTNRKGYCLQTELVGVPEVSTATYTDQQCRWIGEQVVAPQAAWLAHIGRPVNLTQVRYHQNTSGSASENWHGRMSEAEWDAFNGLCAHIDVPHNDHWDCSAERMDRIAAYALAALDGGSFGGAAIPSDESLWGFLMTNDELTRKINEIWVNTGSMPVQMGQHVQGLYVHMDQDRQAVLASIDTNTKGVYTRIEQLEDHGDANWAGGGGSLGAAEVDVATALKGATTEQLLNEILARK